MDSEFAKRTPDFCRELYLSKLEISMKAEEKSIKGTWIGGEFEIKLICQIAEDIDVAIAGNDEAKGIGQEAANKAIMGRFLTKQYDKYRAEEQEKKNKAFLENLKKAKGIDAEKLAEAEELLGISLNDLIGG